MEFSEWITRKYIEYRGDAVGNDRSISEFAKLFGASQPVMSNWMKKGGKVPKSKKYVDALYNVYGMEVYDILGIEEIVNYSMPYLPSKYQKAITEASQKIRESGAAYDSAEAEEIVSTVFEQYGLHKKGK